MKKIFFGLFILAFAAVLSARGNAPVEPVDRCEPVGATEKNVRIVTPGIGPPGLAMAKLLLDQDNILEGYEVHYETFSAHVPIQTEVMKCGPSIAIVPSTMAAKVYNSNGGYKILGTSGYGNLYFVTTENISNFKLEDLAGKTIGMIGQHATPDLTAQYVLEENNIYNYKFSYYANGQLVLPELINGKLQYALLPEPLVTLRSDVAGIMADISLNEEFSKIPGNEHYAHGFPQATLIVKSQFARTHGEFVDAFQAQLKESIAWVRDSANSAQLQEMMPKLKLGLAGASLEKLAALNDRLNYGYNTVADERQLYRDYYKILYLRYADIIGGQIPDDQIFYY